MGVAIGDGGGGRTPRPLAFRAEDGVTYLEAAVQVLRDAGDALHYTEITERAIQRGLIEPKGHTPELSMGSQLYVAAKKAAEGKGPSIVDALGRGRFGLSGRGGVSRLDEQVQGNNEAVKADLLSFIREIEPRQLEYLVGQLLTELGYEDVKLRAMSGTKASMWRRSSPRGVLRA